MIVLFYGEIIIKKTDPFFQEQLDADKQVLATTVECKNRAERAAVGLLLADVVILNAVMNQRILGTILSDSEMMAEEVKAGSTFAPISPLENSNITQKSPSY